MNEEFSPELLRSMREAAGMTMRILSMYSRVSESAIRRYERGSHRPPRKLWEQLQTGLSGKRVRKERDTWRDAASESPPPSPSFSFEVGHRYSIRDHNAGGKYVDGFNPQYGTLCVFMYEGKRGIHHCFREERGGWTRTYTDSQLVGKKIEEVQR